VSAVACDVLITRYDTIHVTERKRVVGKMTITLCVYLIEAREIIQ
jgi:hypothetical protein